MRFAFHRELRILSLAFLMVVNSSFCVLQKNIVHVLKVQKKGYPK